jgi:hypothetical protein
MSIRKIKYFLLTVSFSTIWLLMAGQDSSPVVEGKLAHDSIALGSQTKINFSIATPDNYIWQWPVLADKITEKVEIVNQSRIDTVRQRRSDLVMLQKQMMITAFDSGYHAIPPFTFKYQLPGDTLWNMLETEPMLLFVAGLSVDLNIPIRDIKGPVSAPLTFMEILPWLLLAIIIVSAIILYRRYLKKKREGVPILPKPVKPKIPPHRVALDALENLQRKKLWQSGRVKEYHSEITDILRHYLEASFNIMAVEMTTSEIMEASLTQEMPSQAREKLRLIFERSDLVKFAKSMPLPAEHEESFMHAVDFIRSSIPLVPEPEPHARSRNLSGSDKFD